MMVPREVDKFPEVGNKLGDHVILPTGDVYEWIRCMNGVKRWSHSIFFFKSEGTQ